MTSRPHTLPHPRADSAAHRTHLRPMDIVRRTGLSKSHVMAEIYAGRLKAFRPGGGRLWLVPIEEFERWARGDDTAA